MLLALHQTSSLSYQPRSTRLEKSQLTAGLFPLLFSIQTGILLLRCRVYAVSKCAEVAKELGFSFFAIHNGGECLADSNLHTKYKNHGKSDNCFDGEGGREAVNVYAITGTSYSIRLRIIIQTDV